MEKLLIFVSDTLLNYYQDFVDFSVDSLEVSLYIIISLTNRDNFLPLFSYVYLKYFLKILAAKSMKVPKPNQRSFS